MRDVGLWYAYDLRQRLSWGVEHMGLNIWAIAKATGGRVETVRRPRFGHTPLLATVAEFERRRPTIEVNPQISYADDAKIAKAFESVRDGVSPERVLWDRRLAKEFHARCRDAGVHAPRKILNRRLITIRKNPSRYAEHGITLSDTTTTDPQPSVLPDYAHAVEFALVRMKYRHGVSIDDILIDPQLAEEYIRTAKTMTSTHVLAQSLLLGALYIRKTRKIGKAQRTLFDNLDVCDLDAVTDDIGPLSKASANRIPDTAGIVEFSEGNRYLYIAGNENPRLVFEQFKDGRALSALTNHFWQPEPDQIVVRVFEGREFNGVPIATWQLKLISELGPVFNWPVRSYKDAA